MSMTAVRISIRVVLAPTAAPRIGHAMSATGHGAPLGVDKQVASGGAQLSPTTSAEGKTTFLFCVMGPPLIRSMRRRTDSLTISIIGCSERVRFGLKPRMPGILSVEAM